MKYIKKRGAYFHYVRRVPQEIRAIDHREFIQVSLKTDSPTLAAQRATVLNQHIAAYWESLILDPTDKEARYKQAIRLARLHGFGYKSAHEVAHEPVEKIIARVSRATHQHTEPAPVHAAVLGATDRPSIKLSTALEKFWSFNKDRLVGGAAARRAFNPQQP